MGKLDVSTLGEAGERQEVARLEDVVEADVRSAEEEQVRPGEIREDFEEELVGQEEDVLLQNEALESRANDVVGSSPVGTIVAQAHPIRPPDFDIEMTSPSPSPSSSPSAPMRRQPRNWARKCERYCCSVVIYIPLVFVHGLTTWAVWVEAGIGFPSHSTTGTGFFTSALGIILYALLNWSYSTAVFTDPGSPLATSGQTGYSHLPTQEPSSHQDLPSFTVKSTGGARFCKKCQAKKPDRAHHCSTCRRCVLKMDHHCPWLATCVGMRNYKPFLLFLIYTTIFCWICFGVTGAWLWEEVMNDGQFDETLMPINYVLLCTISGIIGLVLTGFTGWHLSLAFRNQTTIECLERTRYLSPLRKSMRRQQESVQGQSYGRQLAEIHANAVPGATRDEEGEEMLSPRDLHRTPAQQALRQNYNDLERSREQERYEEYLDEQDSEKLPNAFDLGWKTNLQKLFGKKPLYWFLPVCNTEGDGWHWEPSQKWLEAREDLRRRREVQGSQQHHRPERNASRFAPQYLDGGLESPRAGLPPDGSPKEHFDHQHDNDSLSSNLSLKTLRRRESFEGGSEGDEADDYDASSDEEAHRSSGHGGGWYGSNQPNGHSIAGSDWKKRE
ncbi:MAG: hypothetical protein Q9173_005337 [Seirophora scorigena]